MVGSRPPQWVVLTDEVLVPILIFPPTKAQSAPSSYLHSLPKSEPIPLRSGELGGSKGYFCNYNQVSHSSASSRV